MSFLDNLKKKANELDLKNKAEQLQEAATKAAHQARERAGELANENREKIDSVVEKAGAKIDERTEGKYADKVAKAKDAVGKGVDKVAEGAPPPGAAGGAGAAGAGAAGAGGAADAAGATWPPDGEPADPDAVVPSSVNPPEVLGDQDNTLDDAVAEAGDPLGYDSVAGDAPAPTDEALTDSPDDDPYRTPSA